MKHPARLSFDEVLVQYQQHIDARANDAAYVGFAERVLSTLRRRFLAAFAKALGGRVELPRQPVAAFWLDREGKVNNLQVIAYTAPRHGCQAQPFTPLIPRISLNCLMAHVSKPVLHRLGVPDSVVVPLAHYTPPPSTPRHLPLRLELTVLPEQLVAFAPWVAFWYTLQHSPEPLPPPPFPCHFWRQPKDPRDADYAWSQDAHALHDACARQRPRARTSALPPDTSPSAPVGIR